MTNRISSKIGDEEAVKEPIKPPVKATRAIVWRCPDCDRRQVAERSTTHTGKCYECGHMFTILAPPERDR